MQFLPKIANAEAGCVTSCAPSLANPGCGAHGAMRPAPAFIISGLRPHRGSRLWLLGYSINESVEMKSARLADLKTNSTELSRPWPALAPLPPSLSRPGQLLKRTTSGCPVCDVLSPAEVWKIGRAPAKIFLKRFCIEHGEF